MALSSYLTYVWKQALLDFKSNILYALLPEDGGRPPKHVAVKICIFVIYTLYAQVFGVNDKKHNECNKLTQTTLIKLKDSVQLRV